MNSKIKKIIADLRINPGRTFTIIFALIIGLWGIGSILVSYTILSKDLNENFMGTDPYQAAITSKDFGKLDLSSLLQRPDIEKAELRDFATLRIESGTDDWIPLLLFGVEDFNNFSLARFYEHKGSGNPVTPSTGNMLIERNALKFTNLRNGSVAKVRSGGSVINVPIAGIAFDPAQAPGTMDHLLYGYVDKKTFTDITGEAANQRLIIRFKNVQSRQDVQTATTKLINELKSQTINVEKITIPKFNEHPHQWQLNTLLFLEGSIGFLAFFMGAVLVSQLMASILAKQVRQIGILKAIGASRHKILMMYIMMVLSLGVVSGLIAIPLAIKSGFFYAYFVAGILNFEVLTKTLPYQVYFYMIAVSLLLPVILSLPVILKGTKISVRDAISDYGIPQEVPIKAGHLLSQKIKLPNNITMAFRNIFRRKYRLIVTIVAMALGVAIFNTGFNVQQSLKDLLSDVNEGMKHDVQVALINQIPKEEALKYFDGIDNIERIETWNGGRGVMQSMVVSNDNGVGIIALPHNTDLLSFRSIQGHWLDNSNEPEMVMNQAAALLYNNPKLNSYLEVSIGGKKLNAKLIGIVNEVDNAKMYMDKEIYDRLANPDHHINSLMFVAKDKSYGKVMKLKQDIEKAIAPSNLQVLYVMMQAERVKIIVDHLNIVLFTLVFFASLVLLVSAMGMASATSITIMERTREIGVLRAIGATPRMIYSLLTTEGMIVRIVSIILGLLLAIPLSNIATKFFGNLMLGVNLQPAFSSIGLLVTVIVTVIFGWVASRLPARSAIKVTTRDALAYE
jgi:putative ABC transport system permease protein